MAAIIPELPQLWAKEEPFNARIRQKLKAVRKLDTGQNRGPLVAKHEDLYSVPCLQKVPFSPSEHFKTKSPLQEAWSKKEPSKPSIKVGTPRPDSPIPAPSRAVSQQLPIAKQDRRPVVDLLPNKNDGRSPNEQSTKGGTNSSSFQRPDSPIPTALTPSPASQLPSNSKQDFRQSVDLVPNKNDLHSLRRPASLTTLTVAGSNCRSRPSSPSHVGRRTPSPASLIDPSVIDAVRQRIFKVQRARLYLLQQLGPHSFTVGADSPEHKYKVIIGPQSCTCGKGPHCIHILFVMLRVFQVKETDSKLYLKHLKNYEVEELVTQYHQRRKKQVNKQANRDVSGIQNKGIRHRFKSESSLQEASKDEQNKKYDVEEESCLCPICLLEMVEGESLVTCERGCRNKLHQHCIAIWAEECIRQNECILCPLCRAQWPSSQQDNSSTKVTVVKKQFAARHTNSTVDQSFSNTSHVATHRKRPSHILAKPKELQTWEQLFGKEFVSSLTSQNWSDREKSLKWLTRQVILILALSQETPDPGGGSQPKWYGDYRVVVKNCCSIIVCMVPDPVYKVYIASLRCLRAVLTYTLCMGENDLLNLQNLVRPIVKAILLKCANGSRRTSQLSLGTLLEMSRGQAGSLGVGTKTRQPSMAGLGGVEFVLNCALEEDATLSKSLSNWQWLLGRLAVFERLIEEFPQEFYLLYVHLQPAGAHLVGEMAPYKLFNYHRLMMLLQFTKNALSHPHTTVNKMAHKVFLVAASLSAHIPPVFSQVFEIISDLDPNLRGLLLKKLDSMLQELQSPRAWSAKNHGDLPANVPTKNIPSNGKPERSQDHNLVQEKLVCGEDAPLLPNFSRYNMRSQSFSNPSEKNGFSLPRCKSSNDFAPNEGKPLSRPTFLPLFNTNSSLYSKRADPTSPNDTKVAKNNPRTLNEIDQSRPHFGDLETGRKPDDSLLALTLSSTNLCMLQGRDREDENSVEDLIDLSPSLTLTSCSSPLSFGSDLGTPLSPTTESRMAETRGSSVQREVVLDGLLAVALAEDSCRSINFPLIPGLRNSPDEELLITLQPDLAEYSQIQHYNDYTSYVEGIHWMRGPQLGTGAFSTCYQARDVRTGTLMAVKQVSYYRNAEEEQDKVMNEIREEIVMMAKLKHPNILRILGATEQGGHYNFFVEWMAGGSVASLLLQYGSFSETVIIRYTRQVLSGLAYLHDNKILHRDLKGANLLLDSTGMHLRIADFGAAARLASKATLAGEFQGQLLGTIAFMAPEVLRGEDYGRSCDVWSVGCVMIEMATTRPPWNANDMSNHLALIFKIACANKPPPVPEHLSATTRDLARRCLELNSKNRPPTKELLQHVAFQTAHA